ncbi:MAG TPA: GNAT family N-acetyltransferase, partial [Acidimicrobiales bacterium]
MSIQIRTINDDEVPAWVEAMNHGFLGFPRDDEAEQRRAGLDLDRTWAAFDEGQIVGTLRSFATEITVPGGAQVSAAGLTNVTVRATHTRRGLLTNMITPDLAASADRGEAVGILIAAEHPIYGRFGYGPATRHATFEVDVHQAHLVRPGRGEVRYETDPAALFEVVPALYEQVRHGQPGAIAWREGWWEHTLGVKPAPYEQEKGFHVVCRDAAGTATGYAFYTIDRKWEGRTPKGVLTVSRLYGVDLDSTLALWRHVLHVDWVATVKAPDRSPDDPLPWCLSDPRVAKLTECHDFVWLRVLDVAAALSARRYRAAGSLVLDVLDPQGHASGRWHLEGGPDGAECRRTDAGADITLPAGELGAIYLGDVALSQLAAAGRVVEHSPGAVA